MQFCSVLATELRQTFAQRRKMVANFDPWFFVPKEPPRGPISFSI